MNSTKKCSGTMYSSKNKLNSKINRLFNFFFQTHTKDEFGLHVLAGVLRLAFERWVTRQLCTFQPTLR